MRKYIGNVQRVYLRLQNLKLPMNGSRSEWFTGSKEIRATFQNACDKDSNPWFGMLLGMNIEIRCGHVHGTFQWVVGKDKIKLAYLQPQLSMLV